MNKSLPKQLVSLGVVGALAFLFLAATPLTSLMIDSNGNVQNVNPTITFTNLNFGPITNSSFVLAASVVVQGGPVTGASPANIGAFTNSIWLTNNGNVYRVPVF